MNAEQYLSEVFWIFLQFFLVGLGIWGFWWILIRLLAPLVRYVLTGWRKF
jgi:hypothetical protein